jgi:hypothetical protein
MNIQIPDSQVLKMSKVKLESEQIAITSHSKTDTSLDRFIYKENILYYTAV